AAPPLESRSGGAETERLWPFLDAVADFQIAPRKSFPKLVATVQWMLLQTPHLRAQPRNNAGASAVAPAKPAGGTALRSAQRMDAPPNGMDKANTAQAPIWSLGENNPWRWQDQSRRQRSGWESSVRTRRRSRRRR